MATLTIDPQRSNYIKKEYGELIGKTVAQIRPLTKDECDAFCWDYDANWEACVFIFTDGTAFIPMADPEGNGAGFLTICDTAPAK